MTKLTCYRQTGVPNPQRYTYISMAIHPSALMLLQVPESVELWYSGWLLRMSSWRRISFGIEVGSPARKMLCLILDSEFWGCNCRSVGRIWPWLLNRSFSVCICSTAPDRMWRNPVSTTIQSSIRLPMVPHHIILCSCFDAYGVCIVALHQNEAQISHSKSFSGK